jgi:hypothetical protein
LWAPSHAFGADLPRPEHPRPDFQREQWLNLNGTWDFKFDAYDQGLEQEWWRPETIFERQITVPFGWESKLSGIEDTGGHQIGWYRREIQVPADWTGQRAWLRFEAVDWEARVWVNGTEVGGHEGGYTPFAIDITDHLKPDGKATVVVRALDATDPHLPTGKQVSYWYTFTSGIWQTVWLEARPATYLAGMSLVPQNRGNEWRLDVELRIQGRSGTAQVRISSPDSTVEVAKGQVEVSGGTGEFRTELEVRSPRLWTPEDPNLYDLRVEVGDPEGAADEVQTYFGLRTIARGRYGDATYESVLLNGVPVYLRGALDQSFNPWGVHTAPSDEFLRADMELAKSLGLNFLRIHIKPDEPRRLYWADKLGVLIMEDMPNTWVQSERARRAWESTMREVIERDRNHPSIFSWVLFNETWGLGNAGRAHADYREDTDTQQWVLHMFREVKEDLDPSRLVEDNSPNGWDHVKTDLNTWHFYIDDYERARTHIEEVVSKTYAGSTFNYLPGFEQDTAPLINSEYGAVSAGGGDRDISWGFRHLTTQLRRHEKIQGYVYTELTDIEFEHNGFANYDRSPKEFGYDAFVPGMTVRDLQGADFVGFDAPPAIVAEPGSDVTIPIFVSHYSDRQTPPRLRVWLTGVDDLGEEISGDESTRPVKWERFRVVEQEALRIDVPGEREFVGAVCLELVDESGDRIAANFVNLIAQHEAEPAGWRGRGVLTRVEILEPRRVALRLPPFAIASPRWKGAGSPALFSLFRAGKFFGYGAGAMEYRFEVPKNVLDAGVTRLEFLAELATKARDQKLDWPQQTWPVDYPQTDGTKLPGLVRVSIGGQVLKTIELPDDPADSRGVLSHQAAFHHGSYGYLVRQAFPAAAIPSLVERLRRDPTLRFVLEVPEGPGANGLSIFGKRSGRFPVDLTMLIDTERTIESDSEPTGGGR